MRVGIEVDVRIGMHLPIGIDGDVGSVPVPMVVAALAFAASGAFALVACCAEIDDATDEPSRRD